jgi:hypothetical protein
MKRLVLVLSLVLISGMSGDLLAQNYGGGPKVEVTPFGGFQWNTRTNTYGGYISTKDGVNFGGTIDVELRRDVELELLYIYFPSEAKIVIENSGFNSFSSDYVEIETHYMQIGYIRSFQKGGKVEPFFAGTIGAVLFTGSDVQLPNGTKVGGEDLWRFAFTLGGGARIYLSDKFGIRLQGRIMAPVYFAGAGLYFGTGGSGFGVSGGLPILQGDFTAGLIFRL